MPADPLSASAAKALVLKRGATWVTKLAKEWRRLSVERRKELAALADDFGDLETLARYYVEPDCQPHNPADVTRDEPANKFRAPVGPSIGEFLKGTYPEHDGSHVMFVLSDAGMGKSSLLMMLKLSHDVKRFWPGDVSFELLKIGADTLQRCAQVEDKTRTVLLLDALDEDPTAWGRIDERLKEILKATKAFRQVVLTCRTQFFPQGVEDKRFSQVVVGGFRCNLLYLSPFSEHQVRAYLKKGVAWTWWEHLQHLCGRESPRRAEALLIMKSMRSLRMRPMLLTQIGMLLKAGHVERWDAYSVYDVLVDRWLEREETKPHAVFDRRELRQACRQLAVKLYEEERRKISEPELDKVRLGELKAAPIKSIDVKGRSLLNRTSAGEYRFAHLSIQEFFVAESFVLGKMVSKLQVTDQILEFLKGWILADPVRARQFPWELLDYSKAKGLARLGHLINEEMNVNAKDKRLRGISTRATTIRLGGADLSDAFLVEANLKGADLREANLVRAHLAGALLPSALLSGAHLMNANLNGADLRSTTFKGATLAGAKLARANLAGANLAYADLAGADLRGATLAHADLLGANLNHAELTGTDFTEANLKGASFMGTDLRGAIGLTKKQLSTALGHLRTTQLGDGMEAPRSWIIVSGGMKGWNRFRERNQIAHPDLCGAYLAHVDLRGANLTGVVLTSANLDGVKLGSADLTHADLRGANLTHADLRGATLAHADLRSATLRGADLIGTDLRSADLRGTKSLMQAQINAAHGDEDTQLPESIVRPSRWLE